MLFSADVDVYLQAPRCRNLKIAPICPGLGGLEIPGKSATIKGFPSAAGNALGTRFDCLVDPCGGVVASRWRCVDCDDWSLAGLL